MILKQHTVYLYRTCHSPMRINYIMPTLYSKVAD